tara:strand:+ start:31011 stop:31565 length:555 start_codon:yes stop_codon:yes gene_type:complete
MVGYLEIILGPMFSGKTSKLLEVYKQCKFCNIPVFVINHLSDTRYSNKELSNHDGVMIPCKQYSNLTQFFEEEDDFDEYVQSEVVIINEAQFFPDLVKGVELMLEAKKRIYLSGLDGDFQRKKFGEILDLIPLCDKVTKLHSLCAKCKDGKPALFSKRLTQETQQTVVGSFNYIPVCRKCYESY